jgi:hypothetical protein
MNVDLSKTPLTEKQIALLAVLHVPFFHDPETGNTYVSKRYWYGITPTLRDALARVVSHD